MSSEKSKRRTRTIANTTEPRWNQSFVYSSIRRADLKLRILEITVWDYVHYGANDFLGEVVIELTSAPLNDEPEWYYLSAHEDILPQHPVHIKNTQLFCSHLICSLKIPSDKTRYRFLPFVLCFSSSRDGCWLTRWTTYRRRPRRRASRTATLPTWTM